MTTTMYRTDEAFGPVPLWLLHLPVSDRAVRLYALLSAERDYGTNMAELGRKRLAEAMRCSLDSLDRAKAELEKVEAISVVRESGDGRIATNRYTIHRINPDSRMGAAIEDVRLAAPLRLDDRTGAARSLQSGDPSSSSAKTRAPTQLSGRKVTADEAAFGVAVLDVFNEVSGRKFGAKESVGKIILRHREHPELDLAAHEQVIRQQFEHPWWKGDPSVSVIYGNGEVFDRALNGVRGEVENGAGHVEEDPYEEGTFRATG